MVDGTQQCSVSQVISGDIDSIHTGIPAARGLSVGVSRVMRAAVSNSQRTVYTLHLHIIQHIK